MNQSHWVSLTFKAMLHINMSFNTNISIQNSCGLTSYGNFKLVQSEVALVNNDRLLMTPGSDSSQD